MKSGAFVHRYIVFRSCVYWHPFFSPTNELGLVVGDSSALCCFLCAVYALTELWYVSLVVTFFVFIICKKIEGHSLLFSPKGYRARPNIWQMRDSELYVLELKRHIAPLLFRFMMDAEFSE